jgi:hypothetical protein
MAAKYWYVAGNGSSNWNVNSVWYNGPGGTGGIANIPTASDDVIINAASGSGTLTITATATCSSLNSSAFTGTLAGVSALNIVSLALTGASVLSLGGTHNYTGLITISGAAVNGVVLGNGRTHGGPLTINMLLGTNSLVFNDLFTCTGTFTLTQGSISGTSISVGTWASANTNTRSFNFTNLYLSSSGATLSINIANQVNLNWNVTNIYLTNTTGTNKSINLNDSLFCNNLYLQGSGASITTMNISATCYDYPNIIISKTSGSFLFGTSNVIRSLTFIEGSTIAWAGASNTTVYGDVILCNSMSITTNNSLTFAGGAYGTPDQIFRTFNKQFTGILQVNDNVQFTTNLQVYGDYSSTTASTNPAAINIISCNSVVFYGAINLTNNISVSATQSNAAYINSVIFNTITSATTMLVGFANVTLGSTTLSGDLRFNSGSLTFSSNTTSSILSFTSSNSSTRTITLNNAIINLTGSGNAWNMNTSTNLTFNCGTSTIIVADKTATTTNFYGGTGIVYYNLYIDRSNAFTFPVSTYIYGSNYFQNFKDFTINSSLALHSIQFASGQITNIYDTFQVGNSINQTYLIPTSTATWGINKINDGLVICQNVLISQSTAYNSNTFYAINNSVNNTGNTNWIFNTPPRRLSSLGAG